MKRKEKLQLVLKKMKTLKPEQFDFSSYVSKMEGDCGSVCCVVGWFPKWFPNSGFQWGDMKLFHKSGEKLETVLSNLLNISEREVNYLFYGHQIEGYPVISPKSNLSEVIAIWKFFINTFEEEQVNFDEYSLK